MNKIYNNEDNQNLKIEKLRKLFIELLLNLKYKTHDNQYVLYVFEKYELFNISNLSTNFSKDKPDKEYLFTFFINYVENNEEFYFNIYYFEGDNLLIMENIDNEALISLGNIKNVNKIICYGFIPEMIIDTSKINEIRNILNE